MTIIVENDNTSAQTLRSSLGPESSVLNTLDAVERHLRENEQEHVVVVGPGIATESALSLAERLRVTRPHVGVVLVRTRVDAKLLSDALRSGVREVVNARELAAINAAARHAQELASRMLSVSGDESEGEDRGRATIITVFSAKGGCGKTTLSTNLGAALAEGGRREVCIVDLDLAFGDVAIAMQLFPTHTISDAVSLEDTLDPSAVASLLTQHSPGLRVLSAPVEPGLAENIPVSLVTRLLSIMREMFDFVIVDTPPAFTDQVLAAFDASDLAVLLATLDIPALKNLKLSLETLELLNYPKERLRLILNRADSKVGLDASEVEKTLRAPISALIPSSRAVPAATNRGVPIVTDQPHHAVSLAITGFVEQHITPLSSASAIPPQLRTDRRGGLLRRKAKQA
jgi:pilus assembly protein CpaE